MATISPSLRRALSRIAADRTRGARELVLAAARALARNPAPAHPATPAELEGWVRAVAAGLVDAQPAMAPFYHLANGLLRAVRGDALSADAERVRRAPLAFLQEAEAYAEDAGEQAARVLPADATVVTYSRSSSVLETLRHAASGGRRYVLRLSEGRPENEGRGMARAALELGHAVEFYTDAALLAALQGADAVLVGADAIGETRFRNKVGTGALTLAAREAGVPGYLVGDPLKILPERFWLPEEPKPGAEVWNVRRHGLEVKNIYFEAVPLAHLGGLILGTGERDPHPPGELAHWPAADYFKPVERLLAGEGAA